MAVDVVRFARQLALPEIGPDGQARICRAHVLVFGAGLAARVAARYLAAGGVGRVDEQAAAPGDSDGGGWLAALDGVDLIVRFDFDDDAMRAAAQRRGVPVLAARARGEDLVDLVVIPARPPAPDAPLDTPSRAAAAGGSGAAAVVAGTLAAAEALHLLSAGAGRGGQDRDRGATSRSEGEAPWGLHLRLPLDGGAPITQRIGGR